MGRHKAGSKNKLVSVVIPTRNEEETVGLVLKEVFAETKKIKGYTFEVLVVDSSTDKTEEIAKRAGAKVITENKRGKGKGLLTGFRESKGDIIIMLDADCSHEAKEIGSFLDKLGQGYGLVVGSRFMGGSEEFDKYNVPRTFGNIMLSYVFCVLFRIGFTDTLNGYKCFRRRVVDKFNFRAKGFGIEIELLSNALKLGYKIGDVRSHERARAGGKMKSSVITSGTDLLWTILVEAVRYRLYKWRLPGSGAKK